MQTNLTHGSITGALIRFSLPMIAGNLLQQLYNITDTLIVGRFLGPNALAAVGSSYTLMTFITSILLGLCMGSGAVFSIRYGEENTGKLHESMGASFILIFGVTIILTTAAFLYTDPVLNLLQVPPDVFLPMKEYVQIIFWGIPGVFLYNYFASLLRSLGNSRTPLIFLSICAVLNIILDIFFVMTLSRGIPGAATATIISQYVSGTGLALYTWIRMPECRFPPAYLIPQKAALKEIARLSFLTSLQQSVMNFGILMVQGLVNSFGTVIMAAFAAAVKIDTFAYMPVQDFGNAFSTFVAQNYGAGKEARIHKGIQKAVLISTFFSVVISIFVWAGAPWLMQLFVQPEETAVITAGITYLRIEGSFYWGIGCLFLLYGLYRAVQHPGMSVVLTVISLGTRVILAYIFSAVDSIGVTGIWWAVPAGWILADITGFLYYRKYRQQLFLPSLQQKNRKQPSPVK